MHGSSEWLQALTTATKVCYKRGFFTRRCTVGEVLGSIPANGSKPTKWSPELLGEFFYVRVVVTLQHPQALVARHRRQLYDVR